jgi:hypothetical protein
MPNHQQRYCRGCKCTIDLAEFGHQGKQYKQCSRCRARIHHRRRSGRIVVCECGREVLETSLRDHRRTLYHEQHMALLNQQQLAKNEAANKSPEQAARKVTPAIDHPKPVLVGHAQRAPTRLVAKPAAAVHVKPATYDELEGKVAAAVHVKPAAAGQAKPAAMPVATGRAELVVKPVVKPAAIPPNAEPASRMPIKAKEPSAQVPRSFALKIPAAPASMTAASLSFERLKQLQSRP